MEEQIKTESDQAKARVMVELEELKVKIVKLVGFIYSDSFNKSDISEEQKCLLRSQLGPMQEYAEILTRRLEVWDK